ncbi:MAG: FHA domain-containing protein [Planctomycetota bacterium]|jgi:pSer/pThr/pTyr-binding forkhead associated (FHA) protein
MDSYELKIRDGNRAGESIPIQAGVSVLGRSPDSHVSFPDDLKISSRHCQIIIEDHGYSIQDLSSRNGTYVNDQRISKLEALRPGDRITIGSTLLEFSLQGDAAVPAINPIGRTAPSAGREISESEPRPTAPEASPAPDLMLVDVVQCRLRQVSDDGYGKLCWISLDQSMEIGRNEWNDYSFPDDIKMSGKHFRVTLQRDGCVIEDLQSKHGTWVNGVRIDRCALANGSKIQAGSTVFLVEIVGIEGATPPAAIPLAPQPGSASPHAASHQKMAAVRSSLHSDLIHVLGNWEADPTPIAWLERLLAQKAHAYLLIDLGRVSIEPLGMEPEDSPSLFDWLPHPASKATPHLFDLRALQAWPDAVEEAWGNDAMMVLSTRTSAEELLEHLRRLLRGGSHEDAQPDAIQGICWPSVLRSLLTVEAAGVAKEYFTIIDAVWMERADDPLTWEWIGKPSILDPLCKSMSIRLREPQEAKTESSPPPQQVS